MKAGVEIVSTADRWSAFDSGVDISWYGWWGYSKDRAVDSDAFVYDNDRDGAGGWSPCRCLVSNEAGL